MLMNDMRKLAGIAGIVFIAILIATLILPGTPPAIDDSDSDLVNFFTDNRSAILLAQWLGFIVTVPALFFFSYFLVVLRQSEGDQPVRTLTALIGIAATAGIAIVVAAFEADHGLEEKMARIYYDLASIATNGQFVALGTYSLFSGWLIVSKRAFPVWCGWIGIGGGVLAVLSSACLAASGALAPAAPLAVFPAVAVFVVYTLALSVLMLRPAKSSLKRAKTCVTIRL